MGKIKAYPKCTYPSKVKRKGRKKNKRSISIKKQSTNNSTVENANMETTSTLTVEPSSSQNTLQDETFVEIEPTLDSPKMSKVTGALPEGRRLVDIIYLFKQISEISKHQPFDCTFSDMEVINEQRLGLKSKIMFRCKMCNVEKFVNLIEDSEGANINNTIVLGTLSTGIGYSTAEELFSIMNIPFMSTATYQKHHDNVADVIHKLSWETIEEAGKEEARLAREFGQVDKNGTPLITVIADGAWSKRSYSTNYDALSGVACIIGARTKKILFLGVRNKYCTICVRSEKKDLPSPEHKCYKNWNQTSTSMEADIIVEGFKKSLDMHGVIYYQLIGDGDSSVSRKLLDARPYGNLLVEKVECRNHLLRNFSKKIKETVARKRSTSKNQPVLPNLRKILERNAYRLRYSINCAIKHRINEQCGFDVKVKNLCTDLRNVCSHVFGEHRDCQNIGYFNCSSESSTVNYIPAMRECGLLDDIIICFNRLIANASSLITNMDTNIAEQYNSIVCKFVGGKRINFSLKGSYEVRCEAAVISFNTSGGYYNLLPSSSESKYTQKFSGKMMRRRTATKITKKIKKIPKKQAPPDSDYGPEANPEPDICSSEYEQRKSEFLKTLNKTTKEIQDIEEKTRGQAINHLWKQERQFRLTASRFGEICKMRKGTSRSKKVKGLLYSSFFGNENTKYGEQHESIAIREFEDQFNLKVTECGFFIDKSKSFIGASPDGLVGESGIVEVKCPKTASIYHPREAIEKKIISFASLDENKELLLKENHNYYFQIQGQLHVTEKEYCYFIIWTPVGLLVQKIIRDDDFWIEKMLPKLEEFYFQCMLPEIIDSRHTRGLSIRSPPRNPHNNR